MVRDGVLVPELAQARPHGHAYLLYPDAGRPLVADGSLLVGDAAGLAYPESGEGIRPAVESALLAAEAIRACGGQYTADRLQAYPEKIRDRFGARKDQESTPAPSASPLKQLAASLLMRTRWFTREIVTRRWFLHEHLAPLST
jgi:flavin-dependent dehydrogenase